MRRSHWLLSFAALLLSILAPAQDAAGDEKALLTVAEATGFRRTASHAEVVALVDQLDASSERIARVDLGSSNEGRAIPALIIAEPSVANAAEARRSGKPTVLLFGGIHSGEACGKEALLILARELAQSESPELLRSFNIAIVPLLNPDGNERVAFDNRPGQNGPEEGAGVRENAQGLDLNRDWVKLEAPETRAIVRFLREWDPLLTIDTHTTNGSYHRFGVTYAGPKHPAGDPDIIRFVRDEILPEAGRIALARSGLRTFPYGNFSADRTLWTTYPDLPRYGAPYRGLRNRLSILSEAYAYSTFEERVRDTREFVIASLDALAARRDEAVEIVRKADRRVVDHGRDPRTAPPLVLRTQALPRESVDRALGYVEVEENGKRVPTTEERDFDVRIVDRFEPVHSVPRPAAYLVPADQKAIIAKLHEHGVRIEELREDVELDVEVSMARSVTRGDKEFQGKRLISIEVERVLAPRRVPSGTIVVPMSQALGTLAGYLLEPEAADGLAAWGLLAGEIVAGEPLPILRLPIRVPLRTSVLSPPDEETLPAVPLTFKVVYEERNVPHHSTPPRVQWLPDGEHWLEVRDGQHYRVHAESGRAAPFLDRESLVARLAAVPGIDEITARGKIESRAMTFDPTATAALIEIASDLYYLPLARDGEPAKRLTSTPAEEEIVTFSPDGRFVAFVRENDLYVVDVDTATERALTTGGSDAIRHGKASWVYYEEVFNRDWKAYWWSPDSKRLAYLKTDSTRVDTFTLVDDRKLDQDIETTRYPQAGETNPEVELRIVPVVGGPTATVDLSEHDALDLLITGVGFTADGSHAWLFVQNRIQTVLDLYLVGTRGGPGRRLLRQTTPAWVDVPLGPVFLADGSFVISSEADGWRHLYVHGPDGAELRRLTQGEWEVRDLVHVDADGGFVYFTATKESPIAEHFYRVPLAGGEIEHLTPKRGQHSIAFSPKARAFVDAWSSIDEPPRAALRAPGGAHIRWLDTQPARDLHLWEWAPVELTTLRLGDGVELEACFTWPPNFDPSRKWPVWFLTYAGPRAPTVSDRWRGTQVWEQVLAHAGIVVFRCDPRSASARGGESAWRAWGRLGAEAHEDIARAMEWLRSEPWVDGSRIGMSGHSFGGYITAYSMTHSDYFCAGIAGAPVTDWRYYDTIYTERYMKTPALNPEGYEETSVVRAAHRLHGRLLLLHGTMDDNVHPQNTIALIDALQKANKDFEIMFYPGYRHGIYGDHYRRFMYDFIVRTMKVEPRSGGGAPEVSAQAASGSSRTGAHDGGHGASSHSTPATSR